MLLSAPQNDLTKPISLETGKLYIPFILFFLGGSQKDSNNWQSC